jgi:hypothetical protein
MLPSVRAGWCFGKNPILTQMAAVAELEAGLIGERTKAALPLRSKLSGALKITDKLTLAMEAVGDKIRLNCQGWEDVKVLNPRQALLMVAINGQLYLMPGPRPQRFRTLDHQGFHEAGYGPDDFE